MQFLLSLTLDDVRSVLYPLLATMSLVDTILLVVLHRKGIRGINVPALWFFVLNIGISYVFLSMTTGAAPYFTLETLQPYVVTARTIMAMAMLCYSVTLFRLLWTISVGADKSPSYAMSPARQGSDEEKSDGA